MTGENLTPRLVRVRDAGLSLRVEEGCIVVRPKEKLTPELRAELSLHKPELLELLAWDEDSAYKLIKDAWAYIAEFHLKTGAPDFAPEVLDGPEDALEAAYRRQDMFALRIAVRVMAQAAVAEFRSASRRQSESGGGLMPGSPGKRAPGTY